MKRFRKADLIGILIVCALAVAGCGDTAAESAAESSAATSGSGSTSVSSVVMAESTKETAQETSQEAAGDVQEAAAEEQQAPAYETADPYDYIPFSEEAGLQIRNTEIKPDYSDNGLLIKEKKEDVLASDFVFERSFDFGEEGEAPVCRLMIDGLAKAGTHVDLQILLDDESVPFVEKQIRPQSEEGNWDEVNPVFLEIEKPIYGKHVLTVKLQDTSTADGKKCQILLRNIRFYRETLPIVYVNIDESLGTIAAMNADPVHDTMCYGGLTIKVPEGYVSDYSADGGADYTGGEYQLDYIRGRGESTWEVSKKPYKIKLAEKADLFGMGASKNWALIANYYDLSFVRNRLTYYLGEALGMPYTPRLVPVEVVMNGNYLGLYYLSENIRVESSRVAIDDLEDYKEGDDISGGYLLALRRNYWEEKEYKFLTRHLERVLVSSPEEVKGADDPDAKLAEIHAYIEDYLNEMEDALFAEDFTNELGKHYTEYMDLESAAKYALIQAFSNNTDAYATDSTYFYKEKDGKLFWGPLWDFDYVAWGSKDTTTYTLDEEQARADAGEFMVPGNRWIVRMKSDPAFVQAVKDVWSGADSEDPATLAYQLQELVKEGGVIDRYEAELASAAANDKDIPGNANDPFGDMIEPGEVPPLSEDLHGEMIRLKRWIRDRISWVDENLDQFLEPAEDYATLHFYDDGKEIESRRIYKVNPYNDLPHPEDREDSYFAGWYGEKTFYDPEVEDVVTAVRQYSYGCTIQEDLDLTARWIAKDDPTLPEALYIQQEEISLSLMDTYHLGVTLMPEGSDGAVFYSSSDPLKATVDDMGMIIARAPEGDVMITVTTPNGLKKECLVHLLPEQAHFKNPVNFISFEETEITLKVGEYKKLDVSCYPEGAAIVELEVLNGNKDVAWMSDGLVVSGRAPGVTEIYVLCGGKSDSNAKIKVTVVP